MMFNGDLDGFAWGGGACATIDGSRRCPRVTWNPPWSFGNLAPLAHEMGHGYGLPHSDNSDGDDDTYDNPWDVMSDGWSNAVYDPTYGSRPKHINMQQRDRLGWVDAANKRVIPAGFAGADSGGVDDRLADHHGNAELENGNAGDQQDREHEQELERQLAAARAAGRESESANCRASNHGRCLGKRCRAAAQRAFCARLSRAGGKHFACRAGRGSARRRPAAAGKCPRHAV